MLCSKEEQGKEGERMLGILSSVSYIMLKKGDYIMAKAFAEQVGSIPRSTIYVTYTL
jgi:hypothetical protein